MFGFFLIPLYHHYEDCTAVFWYLAAQVIVDCIYGYLVYKKKEKWGYFWIVPLIFIGLMLGSYGVFGNLPLQVHRNALFIGFPCFMIGDFIATKKFEMSKLRSLVFLYLGLFFFFLQRFEFNLISNGQPISGDVFVSTFCCCICLLIFITNFKIEVCTETFNKIFGTNLLLYIYAFHIAIGNFLKMLFPNIFSTFLVFGVAFVVCFIVDRVVMLIRKKYKFSMTKFLMSRIDKKFFKKD